ncbi:hypothetical protein C8J57DRAFT_1065619 [Mycena rebaudengoi]|nr:hypothetical protein C8J57DRAFT_1065619 [Mycena rebaudengoi]
MNQFMASERSFEARVIKARDKELKYQKLNYTIELCIDVLWNGIWNGSPIIVTLVTFWHHAVVRNIIPTPSTAFTSYDILDADFDAVLNEMKFALNALPETIISVLQVRRHRLLSELFDNVCPDPRA